MTYSQETLKTIHDAAIQDRANVQKSIQDSLEAVRTRKPLHSPSFQYPDFDVLRDHLRVLDAVAKLTSKINRHHYDSSEAIQEIVDSAIEEASGYADSHVSQLNLGLAA